MERQCIGILMGNNRLLVDFDRNGKYNAIANTVDEVTNMVNVVSSESTPSQKH